jgi:Caspase domain
MQLRIISSLIALCMSLLIGAQDACAQNRLALVIGINDYQNVFSLQKAVGDAKAIQQALQSVGFPEATVNGEKTIEGGRSLHTGVQVPWMYRCGG